MWDKWKQKIFYVLAFVFSLLFGVLLIEEEKNKKLQTEVDTEKFKGQDNLIKQEQEQNNQIVQQEEHKIEQLQKPEAQDLTKTEVEDYWNNPKKT